MMGGLLSEKFLDTNVSIPFAGPPLNTPSLQKYKRVSSCIVVVELLACFPFHVIFILEVLTDGRCLGWLEPVPDFASNLKEGVTETRCFYCNGCCEIHTEPGILFSIITSNWLQDFSCLYYL